MGELKKRGNVWWIRVLPRAGKRYEESAGSDKKEPRSIC